MSYLKVGRYILHICFIFILSFNENPKHHHDLIFFNNAKWEFCLNFSNIPTRDCDFLPGVLIHMLHVQRGLFFSYACMKTHKEGIGGLVK